MAFFDSERLNWPINGDINAWADFVETICIFSEENNLSIEDFTDFLRDDATKTIGEILRAINFHDFFLSSSPRINPSTPLSPLPSRTDEDIQNENGNVFDGDDIENNEREQIQSRLLILFDFLKYRSNYFGNNYPFEVINSTRIRQKNILSKKEHLYLILLLSSEMHLFAPGDRNRIGHLFEVLCKIPFSYLLPATAEKRFFGAGAGNILKADYQGNLHDRLSALAADLNILTHRIIEDPDELSITGDAGLDWVGWVSFSDPCDHQPVYFGQCACGANWIDKQHETSLAIWRNFLELNQSVQCFHFMPRSFRRTSLDWFRRTEIVAELTLIDRYRIIKIFDLIEDIQFDEILNQYTELLTEADKYELNI